uniref:Peptide transporter 3 n=1 Tax=Heterorhabditis bacteriophora TaxID=37862 RepID=A0A1I7WVH8_HETBA
MSGGNLERITEFEIPSKKTSVPITRLMILIMIHNHMVMSNYGSMICRKCFIYTRIYKQSRIEVMLFVVISTDYFTTTSSGISYPTIMFSTDESIFPEFEIFSFAALVYHAFTCLAYLSPLLGSLLADSYLGRFKHDFMYLFVCLESVLCCMKFCQTDGLLYFIKSKKEKRKSVNENNYSKSSKPVSHWLDRASPDHSTEMIQAVKSFVNVAVIFGPLVFFWALFDQQGSTWVLQARRLDGRIGWLTVLPEQINTLNPLIVLIMVPIFEAFVYPAAKKVFKVTPLRKMAIGGLLTALAFVMAGVLQLEVNKTMEEPPADDRIYLQRVGNASNVHGFSLKGEGLINGGNLPSGRTDLASGMYTIETSDKVHKSINLTTK